MHEARASTSIAVGRRAARPFDLDPEFADAGAGDYQLSAASSDGIDEGTKLPAELEDFDVDGDPRVLDGESGSEIVDMGADEYDPG